nr:MAG TPA: Protein of unknown function (DUF1642) [Caudoviricetes sp.]
MNKQELIERIINLPYEAGVVTDTLKINRAGLINLIDQFDEPQKVQVPQIVADYIKYTKDADWDLQEAMDDVAYEDNKDLRKWFNNNIETFARAWLDGYEIEKEKRYIVKVKGADEGYNYLNRRISSESWFFSGESEPLDFRVKHTRKELEKASFGWIFDCKGIEVKEVKE